MNPLRCHYCLQALLPSDLVWVANQDTIICMYYGVYKLGFCSKECLENELRLVMEKLKNKSQTKVEAEKNERTESNQR